MARWQPGYPGPTHGDVPPFGVSYHRLELIPPLKLGPHPQSCAVSTHRPMKAPGSLQARRSSSGFRSRATPTKHHVARVRVARAFAELREPGARARTGACERACESDGVLATEESRERVSLYSPWEIPTFLLHELLEQLLSILSTLLTSHTPLLLSPSVFPFSLPFSVLFLGSFFIPFNAFYK